MLAPLLACLLASLSACDQTRSAPALTPAAAAGGPTEPAPPDGKTVFQAQCVACHSAVAAGIPKSLDAQIDLPGPRAPYQAQKLKAYLLQQDKSEGTHPTAMTGSAAEQDALVAWLVALKPKQ